LAKEAREHRGRKKKEVTENRHPRKRAPRPKRPRRPDGIGKSGRPEGEGGTSPKRKGRRKTATETRRASVAPIKLEGERGGNPSSQKRQNKSSKEQEIEKKKGKKPVYPNRRLKQSASKKGTKGQEKKKKKTWKHQENSIKEKRTAPPMGKEPSEAARAGSFAIKTGGDLKRIKTTANEKEVHLSRGKFKKPRLDRKSTSDSGGNREQKEENPAGGKPQRPRTSQLPIEMERL